MSLIYTGMPLDRCTNQRKNKGWLNNQFNSDGTVFALVRDGDNFFQHENPLIPVYLRRDQLPSISVNSCIFLGRDESVTVFALDCNKLSFSEIQILEQLGVWRPLRQLGSADFANRTPDRGSRDRKRPAAPLPTDGSRA